MAKVKLDFDINFDPLRQAGSHVQNLGTESLRAVQSINNGFRQSAKSVTDFDNTLKTANKDLDAIEKQTTKTGNALGTVSKQTESFGNNLKTMATGFVAGTIITGGLSKIQAAFGHAIDIQRQYEASLKNLQAITGASTADLEFYSAAALDLGVKVKGGAAAAVEAFKLIGGAKPELLANKEALVGVTEAAILLSQASGLELPEAATRLTDAMNQFGAASDQAGSFVDTLAAGAKFGAAEVPQITDALLKFGVAAKSSNISLNESVAAIELIGEKGLKGAEAGTALRNVFAKLSATKILPKEAKKELTDAGIDLNKLSDTTLPLQERLTELSKIQNNANALTRVFGLENKNAAQSILQNLPRLQELTKQIGEQGLGSALEQATINTDTLDQALLEAGNQYDNMLLSITSGDFGEIIKGFVKSANQELKSFATNISDIGTLLTKGFGAVEDKAIERKFSEIATNMTKEQRKSTAEQLAIQIKYLNVQIQNNKSLTDDQREKYNEQLTNKAMLVNAILKLDKKSAVESKGIIAQASEDTIEGTGAELKARLKLQEDFTKELNELMKRRNKAEIDLLTGEEKVNALRKEAQVEIDIFKENFLKKKAAAGKGNELSQQEAEAFKTIEKLADHAQAEALIKIAIDRSNAIANERKKEVANELQFLELKNKLATEQIKGAKNDTGIPEVEFDLLKQRVLLQNQIKFANDSADIKKRQLEAEANATIVANNNEIERLNKIGDAESKVKADRLANDNANLQDNLLIQTDIVGQETENAVNEYVSKIGEIYDKLKHKKFNLLEALGLTKEDLNNIQKGLSEILKGVNDSFDAQISMNEKLIDSSKEKQSTLESEITDLQSKLENEIELSREGLANNADNIRSQIALKESQREAEKELELKAIEEKKKIQRQKLILDSALQASNLLVAATEIYAKAAASTGPLSVPIAAFAIGAMLSGFILQKAAALKAINEGNGFEKGGYTGDIGTKEVAGHVHGQEFVSKAKTTKKHRALLEALHSDNESVIANALIDELKNTGVSLDVNLPSELRDKKETIKTTEAKLFFKQDNSGMESRLGNVENVLHKIHDQGKEKITTMPNGDIHIKKGNSTRIIKAKR